MLSREQMKGLDPIPQGEHRFVITRAAKRPSSTGNPSVEVMLAVPEDTDSLDAEFVARDVKVSVSLQGQAAFTFGNLIASIKGYSSIEEFFDGEDIEEFDTSGWDPNEIMGQEVIGVVSHSLFQGRTVAQIRVFKPIPA